MVVKYERRLLLSVIIVGLLVSPLHYQASEPPIVPTQTEPKPTQATAEEKLPEPCPSTLQKLTLKFKPLLTTLGGAIATAGIAYLYDRSIVASHEGSHALFAQLAGYNADVYVSPQIGGGGWVSHDCPLGTPMSGLIALAGPLGGISAYLAWLQVWNMAVRYWNTGNVKESVLKGRKDPFFNKDSSLLAIGGTFSGIYHQYMRDMLPQAVMLPSTYGALSGTVALNDAAQIQAALANIAPFLAKAYPFMAYAGLAGLMGYGAYGLYATYKAKKAAGMPFG